MLLAILLVGCGARPVAPRTEAAESAGPAGPEAAIAFARAQVGKRYCWGGSGPDCFDCSGLVQAAWGAGGVRLPRTAGDQERALYNLLPGEEVRPGDIYWWGHGHVALYVGDGAVIDAYHSGAGVVQRRPRRPDRVLRVCAPAASWCRLGSGPRSTSHQRSSP